MPASRIRPSGRERYTLVYAIETADGWVMVDTGMDSEAGFQALREQIPQAGLDHRDFTLIVMTHGHQDHFGLAERARGLTGAPIAIHRADDGTDLAEERALTIRIGEVPGVERLNELIEVL